MNGLPAPLPAGETLMWQGTPRTFSFLRQIFGTQLIIAYVGILLGWCLVDGVRAGNLAGAALACLRFALLAGGALVLLAGLARLLARTTIYSITSARIVIGYGAAFEKTLQIPFTCIDAADFREHADGTGDIVLTLGAGHVVNYFFLWPHVLPWRMRSPRPALRALPDAAVAARILSRAMAGAAGVIVRPVAQGAPVPELQGAPGLQGPVAA